MKLCEKTGSREKDSEFPPGDVVSTERDPKKNEHWDRPIEFFLSMLSVAVGLSNIWRFPYLCMRNGGGVFLIPYFTALFTVGLPLYYLEMILGQFAGMRVTEIFCYCPLIKGVGWSMVFICFVIAVQYSHCITWVIYYLAMSFSTELPWASCNNTWNSENCSVDWKSPFEQFQNSSNYSEPTPTGGNLTNFSFNMSAMVLEQSGMSAAEEFWQYRALELTSGIEDLGGLRWQLVLCHIAAWVVSFGCVIRGIKSTGKVVYVTSTVPYILLTILVVRGSMLPGAKEGLLYYVSPVWHKLLDMRIWSEAFLQLFLSLGLAYGGIITYSSYNKFGNNIRRDAILITVLNCFTSLYGGCAVFAVLGYMAHNRGVPVDEVVTSGPGLAFIAYPEALSLLPLPNLWSVLFFLMLATLGFGSQFGHLLVIVTGVEAAIPKNIGGKHRRLVLLGITCFMGVILGLVFCTRGGMYYFQIIDWYGSAFSMVINALIMSITVTWAYGFKQVSSDIHKMLGVQTSKIYKIMWGAISPLALLVVFLYSVAGFVRPSYGNYIYPDWAVALAWLVAVVSMAQIPIFAAYGILKTQGTLLQRIKKLLRPSADWGPQDPDESWLHENGNEKHLSVNQDEMMQLKS